MCHESLEGRCLVYMVMVPLVNLGCVVELEVVTITGSGWLTVT